MMSPEISATKQCSRSHLMFCKKDIMLEIFGIVFTATAKRGMKFAICQNQINLFDFSSCLASKLKISSNFTKKQDNLELEDFSSSFYGKNEISFLRLPFYVNREIKHDVYGQRQTGNGRLLLVIKA